MAFVNTLLNDAKARLGKLPPGYGAAGFALAVRLGKNDMFPIFLDAGVRACENPIFWHGVILRSTGGYLQSAVTEAIRFISDQHKTATDDEQLELLEQGLDQLTEACHPPDSDS
jgi:hypothetical protein